MKLATLLFILAAAWNASAEQITEDFSTHSNLDSETAIWNKALGVVHTHLQITNYNPPAAPLAMDVGDGSDGPFNPATYANFGAIVGNHIQIDTDVHQVLQVTTFLLEDGWVIEPIGSRALVIRSQSDVIIRGEIWCHGNNAVGAVGGDGRCGGKRGGDAGAAGTAGQPGEDSLAPVTGGQGGAAGAASKGGGGGGGWSLTSTAANGAGFVNTISPTDPGEAGASSSDPTFTNLAGGAGGGGGGGGTAGINGAGGGGGGVVHITAVRDFELGSSTNALIGFIFANGGNGADRTGDGGNGAGGGGGGVFVAVGGTIRIYSNSGVAGSQAVGGRNPAPFVGAAGGIGRSFFSSIGYSSAGFYDPSEELPVGPGTVEFKGPADETITSKSFDLRNTLADVLAISPSPTSADFSFEVAGSSDDFVSDDTGWITDLSLLKAKRYLKFRATIRNSSPSAPTFLSAVTVAYAPGTREKFDFKAAGCARVDSDSGRVSPMTNWISLLLMFLPLILLVAARYKKCSETF